MAIEPDDDLFLDDFTDVSLIDDSCGAGVDDEFIYDEDGGLMMGQPAMSLSAEQAKPVIKRPCSMTTLNGSWLLTLTPASPHLPTQIRGPMRIEVQQPKLRISGDIYVKSLFRPIAPVGPIAMAPDDASPFVPGSLVIRRNWYPAFPQREYRWYFRSTGVSYAKGRLLFKFQRHIWNTKSEAFVSSDNGWMEFFCTASIIRPIGVPQPTIEMTGKAMIAGTTYNVSAVKTSPFYRGCLVEVDVMTNRQWPATAQSCNGGQSFSFTGVYRATGVDFRAVVNEVNIPEDPHLTISELHTLLATHRSLSPGGDNWHMWLLVGSRMNGTLGIMFDTGNPPHREGAVGFYDPTLSNSNIIHSAARGKKLGEVPLAFLRTLVHEAGHAFNLFHPKHDVHGVPVGTTIMNQTGDVIGFASTTNPYPCNATMAFNEHNQTSLVHSPDPQVKPGWKEFGWGHGSAWSGVAEPVDAAGLDDGGPPAVDLDLTLDLVSEASIGEFVTVTVTVTNKGAQPREVTTALNLAEGDLRMHILTPSGREFNARDVLVICGERRLRTLEPGEGMSGTVQLFYGPEGLTFDQPGRYEVQAELSVGDGSVATSEPVTIVLRPATTDTEREVAGLMMDKGVGLGLALGDFGADSDAQSRLVAVMNRVADTETGAACAMVVANSLANDLRDVLTTRLIRQKDEKEATRALDLALKGRDAATTARLCTAVVSPRETDAPLIAMVAERIRKTRKGGFSEEDKARAQQLISDHLA